MTDIAIVSATSLGIFAAGLEWFQAPSAALRDEAKEIAARMGDRCSACALVPATDTVPAHIGVGSWEKARSIGGPVAGAVLLLAMHEPDAAVVVELDDGRWWSAAKVANMLVPGTDLIHDTLEEAAGRLEEVQRHAQSSLTLVVDQELDIAGWPSRQPLRRLEEASRTRRLPRVQHLAAPTRIARSAAAAFLVVALVPTVVYAGIVGLRPPEDPHAGLPPAVPSAAAPRPADAVALCYERFSKLLYQDGWTPRDFECVLDPAARRELAGNDRTWSSGYVAARYLQGEGSATAFREWAKNLSVTLNKGMAIAVSALHADEFIQREPETLLAVGLAEAQMLDTGTRLGEPLEVRRRGKSGLAFEVTSQVPARHWGRVLALPGLRITRIAVSVANDRIQWSIAGDVDAL